jgi:O-6-methylguanine DNA methyltransferase
MKTPFAQLVYAIVARIPKGKTLTYMQVAAAAGRPGAARAIGNIMNKNNDPRVPCHRVIRSDGSAGGFNGGAAQKRHILRKEGVSV